MFKRSVFLTVAVAVPAFFQLGNICSAVAEDVPLKTDDQKALYTLGVALAGGTNNFNLRPEEGKFVVAGFEDALAKKPKVDPNQFREKLASMQNFRAGEMAASEKTAGKAFLEKAAGEKGAVKTTSGLVYLETEAGKGDSPKATDQVKVNYKGTLIDGSVFDSSYDRKQPITIGLNQVIPCWTEGMQLMKVGGKGKLVCPSEIAYGDRGAPPKIKPGSTLSFDVELLEIVKADAAKAPAPAKK